MVKNPVSLIFSYEFLITVVGRKKKPNNAGLEPMCVTELKIATLLIPL